MCAGLLHDTVEDTRLGLGDVEDVFGPAVRRLVEGETKVRAEKGGAEGETKVRAEKGGAEGEGPFGRQPLAHRRAHKMEPRGGLW